MIPTQKRILVLRGGKSKRKAAERKMKRSVIPTKKRQPVKQGWFMRFLDALTSLLGPKKSNRRSSKQRGKVSSKSMTQEHLEKSFSSGDANARIQKELRAFISNPPDNLKLSVGANMRVWIVTITGAENTIYAGEKYKLKIVFPKEYPTRPPGVFFLKPTPKHMHVYSNGDICLNLLGRDWRPTMTAQTLAISILSMLSNAKEKKIPTDNALHADNPPGQAQDNWMYHDDTC
jgi:ubiquitin-conjugating enzyme E2 W